jgi:hypothetical protein
VFDIVNEPSDKHRLFTACRSGNHTDKWMDPWHEMIGIISVRNPKQKTGYPHSRPVFKGVYARNRLPRLLNVPSALVGNTDPDHRMRQHWVAIYIDANSRGDYYDPTGRPPHKSAYVNFMNKHCLHWTCNTVRVQEEGSTVCGHHCIFYLFHRCAGHSMTDVTRLLENPVEATDIVQKFVLLLARHVL